MKDLALNTLEEGSFIIAIALGIFVIGFTATIILMLNTKHQRKK
jgi:hypothetical protein